MVFGLSLTLVTYVFVVVISCMLQFMGPVLPFSQLGKLLVKVLGLGVSIRLALLVWLAIA